MAIMSQDDKLVLFSDSLNNQYSNESGQYNPNDLNEGHIIQCLNGEISEVTGTELEPEKILKGDAIDNKDGENHIYFKENITNRFPASFYSEILSYKINKPKRFSTKLENIEFSSNEDTPLKSFVTSGNEIIKFELNQEKIAAKEEYYGPDNASKNLFSIRRIQDLNISNISFSGNKAELISTDPEYQFLINDDVILSSDLLTISNSNAFVKFQFECLGFGNGEQLDVKNEDKIFTALRISRNHKGVNTSPYYIIGEPYDSNRREAGYDDNKNNLSSNYKYTTDLCLGHPNRELLAVYTNELYASFVNSNLIPKFDFQKNGTGFNLGDSDHRWKEIWSTYFIAQEESLIASSKKFTISTDHFVIDPNGFVVMYPIFTEGGLDKCNFSMYSTKRGESPKKRTILISNLGYMYLQNGETTTNAKGETVDLHCLTLDGRGKDSYYNITALGKMKAKGPLDTTSDKRLKNFLGFISEKESLILLNKLKPLKFSWKTDKNNTLNYGLFAQDVRDILTQNNISNPSLVNISFKSSNESSADLSIPETDNMEYSINYTALINPLIIGWQAHEREIQELKAKNAELEAKLNSLLN